MYADDSKLYAAGKCVADINRTLTTHSKPLYQWINANRMVLNADKNECIFKAPGRNFNAQLQTFVYMATTLY